MNWRKTYQRASFGSVIDENRVSCQLCPRNCIISEGCVGSCGVRGNIGGELVSFSYGKGLHLTEEVIETEAVYHFAPGARILSLGNIGCNLKCIYCQNWKTSQIRHISEKDIKTYTPEEIVQTALLHNIRILSWTYNDPVVWHEFVIDTARLAKEAGLLNLYKSAFFITKEAVDELLTYIDIFSISIKAIQPEYYRKMTGGRVQPVLDATERVYAAGKYLEISNLMITDISDDEKSARMISEWVLKKLGSEVPLHFVRFHPCYLMQDTVRTPIQKLHKAREIAKEMGIKHVYLGNVYNSTATSSKCIECGAVLVYRFGLHTEVVGFDESGLCNNCGHDNHFRLPFVSGPPGPHVEDIQTDGFAIYSHKWEGDICSLHVQVHNKNGHPSNVYHRACNTYGKGPWHVVPLESGESYRFILTKSGESEFGQEIAIHQSVTSNLHEILDRAHYPTESFKMKVQQETRESQHLLTGVGNPL